MHNNQIDLQDTVHVDRYQVPAVVHDEKLTQEVFELAQAAFDWISVVEMMYKDFSMASSAVSNDNCKGSKAPPSCDTASARCQWLRSNAPNILHYLIDISLQIDDLGGMKTICEKISLIEKNKQQISRLNQIELSLEKHFGKKSLAIPEIEEVFAQQKTNNKIQQKYDQLNDQINQIYQAIGGQKNAANTPKRLEELKNAANTPKRLEELKNNISHLQEQANNAIMGKNEAEERNKMLCRQINEVQVLNTNLNFVAKRSEEEKTKLNGKVNELLKTTDTLKSEVVSQKEDINILEEKIRQLNTSISSNENEIEALKVENDRIKENANAELNKIKNELSAKTIQIDNLKAKLKEVLTSEEQTMRSSEKFNEENVKLNLDLEFSKQSNLQLQIELKHANETIESMTKQIEINENENVSQNTLINDTVAKLEQINNECQTNSEKIIKKKQRILDLKKENDEKTSKINELTEIIKSTNNSVENLKIENESEKDMINRLTERSAILETEIAAQKAEVASLNSDCSNLIIKLHEKDNDINQLKGKIAIAEDDNKEKMKEIDSLNQRVQEHKQKLDKSKEKLKEKAETGKLNNQDIMILKKDVLVISNQLDETEKENHLLLEKIEELKVESEIRKKQAQENGQKIEEIEKENFLIKNIKNDLEKEKEELVIKINTLKRDITELELEKQVANASEIENHERYTSLLKENQVLQKDINEIKNELLQAKEAEKALQISKGENLELHLNLEQQFNENHSLILENDKEKAIITEISEKLNILTNEKENVENEMKEQSKRYQSVLTEINENKLQIQSLNTESMNYSNRIEKIQKELEDSRFEIQNIMKEKEMFETENNQKLGKIQAMEKDIEKIKQEKDKITLENEKKLIQIKEEKQDLFEKNQKLHELNQKLEAEINKQSYKNQEIEKELLILKQKNLKLNEEKKNSSEENQNLKNQNEKQIDIIHKIEEELKDIKEDRQRLIYNKNELLNAKSEFQLVNENYEQKIKELINDKNNLSQSVIIIEQSLNKAKEELLIKINEHELSQKDELIFLKEQLTIFENEQRQLMNIITDIPEGIIKKELITQMEEAGFSGNKNVMENNDLNSGIKQQIRKIAQINSEVKNKLSEFNKETNENMIQEQTKKLQEKEKIYLCEIEAANLRTRNVFYENIDILANLNDAIQKRDGKLVNNSEILFLKNQIQNISHINGLDSSNQKQESGEEIDCLRNELIQLITSESTSPPSSTSESTSSFPKAIQHEPQNQSPPVPQQSKDNEKIGELRCLQMKNVAEFAKLYENISLVSISPSQITNNQLAKEDNNEEILGNEINFLRKITNDESFNVQHLREKFSKLMQQRYEEDHDNSTNDDKTTGNAPYQKGQNIFNDKNNQNSTGITKLFGHVSAIKSVDSAFQGISKYVDENASADEIEEQEISFLKNILGDDIESQLTSDEMISEFREKAIKKCPETEKVIKLYQKLEEMKCNDENSKKIINSLTNSIKRVISSIRNGFNEAKTSEISMLQELINQISQVKSLPPKIKVQIEAAQKPIEMSHMQRKAFLEKRIKQKKQQQGNNKIESSYDIIAEEMIFESGINFMREKVDNIIHEIEYCNQSESLSFAHETSAIFESVCLVRNLHQSITDMKAERAATLKRDRNFLISQVSNFPSLDINYIFGEISLNECDFGNLSFSILSNQNLQIMSNMFTLFRKEFDDQKESFDLLIAHTENEDLKFLYDQLKLMDESTGIASSAKHKLLTKINEIKEREKIEQEKTKELMTKLDEYENLQNIMSNQINDLREINKTIQSDFEQLKQSEINFLKNQITQQKHEKNQNKGADSINLPNDVEKLREIITENKNQQMFDSSNENSIVNVQELRRKANQELMILYQQISNLKQSSFSKDGEILALEVKLKKQINELEQLNISLEKLKSQSDEKEKQLKEDLINHQNQLTKVEKKNQDTLNRIKQRFAERRKEAEKRHKKERNDIQKIALEGVRVAVKVADRSTNYSMRVKIVYGGISLFVLAFIFLYLMLC